MNEEFQYRTKAAECGIETFEFIVSKRVQANTDDLRAMCALALLSLKLNTPNANMADHSVGARDERHVSEVSQALMFCFRNAFPEKSCFVVYLVPFFRPLYPFVFLNATARE